MWIHSENEQNGINLDRVTYFEKNDTGGSHISFFFGDFSQLDWTYATAGERNVAFDLILSASNQKNREQPTGLTRFNGGFSTRYVNYNHVVDFSVSGAVVTVMFDRFSLSGGSQTFGSSAERAAAIKDMLEIAGSVIIPNPSSVSI